MAVIVDLLLEYRLYVILGLFLLLGLLALTSETLRSQLRKGFVLLLMAAGLAGGYYLFTGKSPLSLLGEINRFFNDPKIEKEPSHQYYKPLQKRYGDQLE